VDLEPYGVGYINFLTLVLTVCQPYVREEQFQGPKDTKKKTKEYLDKFFKNLKKKGIVSIYKIRESYFP
jgi:hypothetical protein